MTNSEVRAKGWVSKYLIEKGFGFIAMPNKNKLESDIFFHISDVEGESIKMDDNVDFALVQTDKGLKAIDIKIVGGDLDANG